MSVTGKATSYFPGLPEWDVPTKSQTTSDFIVSPSFLPQNYGPQPTRKPYKTNKNNVNLGDEKFEYKSLAAASYKQIPKDFKKVRPLKERQELLATNYELGNEATDYLTSNM